MSRRVSLAPKQRVFAAAMRLYLNRNASGDASLVVYATCKCRRCATVREFHAACDAARRLTK